MVRSVLGLAILCFSFFASTAQSGVSPNSFSFLNIANNARVNALGGINVSLADNDVNLFSFNPALLDSSQKGQIGVNFSPYLAQSKFTTLNYSPKFKHKNLAGNWGISLQNLNYGAFQGTDALGNLTNEFSANDFSLGLTHSRKISHISFGITAKLVGSIVESYNSIAFLTDWGGTFKHPKHDLSFGIVAKNVGFVLKSYANIRPEIPFDLQIGATFKPQYMPVRFSITGHHLYIFDIAYNNPNISYTFDNQGNKIPNKISGIDKTLRHLIVGTEILIHKNFNILFAYNHLRRKDLVVNSLGGGAGLSFGVNFRTPKVGFSMSRSAFGYSTGQTSFSLIFVIPKS